MLSCDFDRCPMFGPFVHGYLFGVSLWGHDGPKIFLYFMFSDPFKFFYTLIIQGLVKQFRPR